MDVSFIISFAFSSAEFLSNAIKKMNSLNKHGINEYR